MSLVLPALAGSYDDDENNLSGYTYFQGEIINPTCQMKINGKNIFSESENIDINKSFKIDFIFYGCNEESLKNLGFIYNQINYKLSDYDDVILSACDYKQKKRLNDSCDYYLMLANKTNLLNGFITSIEGAKYKKFTVRYDVKYDSDFIKNRVGIASEFLSSYQ